MNNLIFSLFVLLIWLFRQRIYPLIQKGQVKEGFCALWFINSLFSLCGAVLSFYLYRYTILPFFSRLSFFFVLAYLAVSILVFLIAPAGFRLFTKKSAPSEEETLLAEYRFHKMSELACRFFRFLLFCIPILIAFAETCRAHLPAALCSLLDFFVQNKIYGGLCFFAFLFLLPLSLRQTLYWMKSLKVPTTKSELPLQRIYSARLRYKRRNRIL